MQMEIPCLSVIIPIYGVEKYLTDCINSVLNQTYSNLEILLIDDGSTGREPEICDYYAQNDQRIKVIHKQNEGLIAARKTGLKYATSQYVTFLDGDDYLSPTFYAQMMQWIISEDPDLVAVNCIQVSPSSERSSSQCLESGIYTKEKLIYLYNNMNCMHNHFYDFGIWPSTCLKIYNTSLLCSFAFSIPNNIRMGEDSSITFPYILKCNKIIIDNDINGYYYRMVPNSMSKSVDESLFTGCSALYDYLNAIYTQTASKGIIIQLEYYRALLMQMAINYWMNNIKLTQIIQRTNQIKTLIESTTLFHNMESVLELDLPTKLHDKLTIIYKKKWRKFKLRWMKELVLSYLHTMVKKLFIKA